MQRARLGSDRWFRGAKVSRENFQRGVFCGRLWNDERIVVSRNRENRAWIVPKRIVKLVVVILRLTKVINDVSQMIKEGSSIRGVGRAAVACHLVSHANLVSVLSFV